jgi:hypothetical protein
LSKGASADHSINKISKAAPTHNKRSSRRRASACVNEVGKNPKGNDASA